MHLTKKNLLILIGIFLVVAVIFILKILSVDTSKRPLPKPVVVAGNLSIGEIQRTETLNGDFLPVQQANIYSKVSGNIEKIFFDIGSRVMANQVIALIDTTIYSQNSRQAKANLMQGEANYQNAKLNYERNKVLLEQKLIAQQDLDNAKAAFDIASAQKESAQASYNNAQTQLSYCKVTAPFSGTITKRMFDPGSYVTSSTSSQSSTLFVVMNVDRLKITVNVPERSVPNLQNIKEIIVTADAVPDKKFTAKISKISQAVDLATRTMAIELELENSGLILKPGMFATVKFVTEEKKDSKILPNQTILSDEYGEFVYLVKQDTSVEKRYVKTGIKQDDKVEILSGLNETDRIVVVGQTLIKDKMKVKLSK